MNTSNLTPNQMNIEQLAIEQQPQIKPLWLVIDEQGYPIHCASYKEACNEHINDAINDFDLTEAKYWKVVEAVPKALQSSEAVESGTISKGQVAFFMKLSEEFKAMADGEYKLFTLPPSTISLEEHNKRIAELEADIDTYVPIANQQATEIVQLQATNKTLLDALNSLCGTKTSAGWLGEIDDILYSMLDDEQYSKVSREINRAKAEGLQAIADAEGVAG